MLAAFANAFRTPDLRKKIFFTLAILAVFRLGSIIPTPNVNVAQVDFCLTQATSGDQQGLYSLINLFSGGALLQLAIFALGIMPYITASIILQLLTVVIPRLEALKKEGQSGQTKITQYTRYLTLVLAVLNATAFVTVAVNDRLFTGCTGLVYSKDIFPVMVMILTMTAGTSVIMWMGELITERGVGNGMSVLIFTQIAATFPSALWSLKVARPGSQGWVVFLLVIALGLVVMAGVIFVEQSQRRIPVQYAKRMVGRRMFGGTTTYIPIKVNQAGVIPVIFASSLLYLPALYAQFQPDSAGLGWIQANFITGDHPIYMATFFLLIVFFAYFYVAITFNPEEVADNMKKYGGFIPGIRAGKPTEDYLGLRAVPADLPRLALPRADRAAAVGRVHPAQRQPELPLRRYLDPDHRRRRPRHREADRDPAPATQLRRVPPLMRLLIMGPPGAGKGTQAGLIAEHYGIPAISTGDIFRAMKTADTPLAHQVRAIMDSGGYVSDEITNAIVVERLAEPDCENGFLLDGYPRTLAQVETLDAALAGQGHAAGRGGLAAGRRRGGRGPAAQAGRDRGPLGRQRGHHPGPAAGLRRADRAAAGGLPAAGDPGRGRRPRPDRRGVRPAVRRAGQGRPRSQRLEGVRWTLPGVASQRRRRDAARPARSPTRTAGWRTRTPPETVAWVAAQNEVTEAYLAGLPDREWFAADHAGGRTPAAGRRAERPRAAATS